MIDNHVETPQWKSCTYIVTAPIKHGPRPPSPEEPRASPRHTHTQRLERYK
jgi:hypothetical protein